MFVDVLNSAHLAGEITRHQPDNRAGSHVDRLSPKLGGCIAANRDRASNGLRKILDKIAIGFSTGLEPCRKGAASETIAPMRAYLNAAALVSFLIGAGLALTGYGNAWLGFACFYFAGTVLLFDLLEIRVVTKHIGVRKRRFLLAAMLAATILLTWHRMASFAREKKDFEALSNRLLARFASGELKPQPSLPGASVHAVLSIRKVTTGRKQYIFDLGGPAVGQLGAYVSPDNVFILVLTDRKGESFELLATIGQSGIPLDRAIYLICDVGSSETETFMRLLVDGDEVANRTLPFKTDVAWSSFPGGTLGNDSATKSNGGSFLISQFAVYDRTLTNEEMLQNLRYFDNSYSLLRDKRAPKF